MEPVLDHGPLTRWPFGEPDDGAPEAVIRRLREGNRRFVDGSMLEPRRGPAALAARQAPFAAILACADAPTPEIMFDAGFGDLFVVSIAGNVATHEEIAGLEFGTLVGGARAIVILGHTHCRAIEATLAGMTGPGPTCDLFRHIASGLDRTDQHPDAAVEGNALAQRRKLLSDSPVIASLSDRGRLAVVAAVYDDRTGAVRILA